MSPWFLGQCCFDINAHRGIGKACAVGMRALPFQAWLLLQRWLWWHFLQRDLEALLSTWTWSICGELPTCAV